MSDEPDLSDGGDSAPGERRDGGVRRGILVALIGLALAGGLTAASFAIGGSGLIWAPAIPTALVVLAIAQMGIHLVFFLHITTGPDNTNNTLALAFGLLIVFLVIGGTLWIMGHLDHNMLPTGDAMRMMH